MGSVDDLQLASEIARAAGDRLVELRREFGSIAPDDSARRDELMAEGDRTAQAVIAEILHRERPSDSVLSEEAPDSRKRLQARRVWIIDPLDGTSEFGQGRGDFAVHVALWQAMAGVGQLTDAVVDVPVKGELWSTARAEPAALPTDRPLRMVVSRSRRPAGIDAVLAAVSQAAISAGVNASGMIEANVGSVGAKVGEILAGRAEAYLHPGGLREWDLAAPYACAMAHGYTFLRGAQQQFNQMPPVAGPVLIVHPDIAALFPARVFPA